MKGAFVDIEKIHHLMDMLDMIDMFKQVHDHGGKFKKFTIECDSDSIHEYKVGFLDEYCQKAFCEFEEHLVNDPEFVYAEHFQDVAQWFDHEETSVWGYLFVEDYLYEFYLMCKDLGIKLKDTPFCDYVCSANDKIPDYGDGYSYFELFVPSDKIIESSKCTLMLFYTDPSLIDGNFLCNYFDALKYCKDVVDGKIQLKKGE